MEFRRNPAVAAHAISALVPAAFFFFFGWVQSFDTDSAQSAFYNGTVHLFNWTLRAGCVVYVLIAAMCWAQLVPALLFDAIWTGCCVVVFLIVGVAWSLQGFVNGYLLLVFALMFGTAARGQYAYWQTLSRTGPDPAAAAPAVEPVHPASVRPEVLPKENEPPPAEGYLAALAREKKEPPRADLE